MMSPTLEAAKGVPFFAPLNPREPDEDQNNVLPDLSEKVTLVLLKVASTERIPAVIFFLPAFPLVTLVSVASAPSTTFSSSFSLTFVFGILFYVLLSLRRPEAIVFRTLPRTVRELVFIRCPRTGRRFI